MKEYTQVIKGHYDSEGTVKAIDVLNDKPLTPDYLKLRPDIKQRVEKAINTRTYLATYPRGTRQGFEWIEETLRNCYDMPYVTYGDEEMYGMPEGATLDKFMNKTDEEEQIDFEQLVNQEWDKVPTIVMSTSPE